jgi:hypothetical protein
MLESYDGWFAVREGHDEDKIRPGRLTFSSENGVVLETIISPDNESSYEISGPDIETITGYLDYQRPTTIVKPLVQSRAIEAIGVNITASSGKARIIGNAILKNIHLTDMDERCFTGFSAELPAFSAWYAPKMVKTGFSIPDNKRRPEIAVAVDRPEQFEILLDDQTKATIKSYAHTAKEGAVTSLTQRTSLWLQFPEAINYEDVLKRIRRVNTLFSFLLGHRMAPPPHYRLHTTHTRRFNDKDWPIVAELLFRPALKGQTEHVEWHEALFTRHNCAPDTRTMLNALAKQPEVLFYLMDMVWLMERPKKLLANSFSELMGCLEDFDQTVFGSGSSSKRKTQRKSLKAVVSQHGSEADKQTLDDLINRSPNRYSLKQRIERLQKTWIESGFRESPDAAELVKFRNAISHGQVITLESSDYKKMLQFSYYLCALSRFHIFRRLGLPDKDIGEAFRRVSDRYGMYAPSSERGSA